MMIKKGIAVILCCALALGTVDLARAPWQNVALATPGDTLRHGDENSDVKELQALLIAQGYLKGKADGKFGDATLTAVKAFQKAKGLTADGAAGQATWNKLLEAGTPTLRHGATGASVTALQNLLIAQGHLKGSADGSFGNGTLTAVKAFQKANGLAADGTVGKATWSKLRGTATSGGGTSTGSRATVRRGDQGSDVKALQEALIKRGNLKGSADGNFGNGTLTALKAFQKSMNITADGVAGPTTWAMLMFSRSLRQGMSGDDVKELQTILKKQGYLTGAADGKFGSGTKKAVAALQKDRGISADGVAGSKTFASLYKSSGGTGGTGAPAAGDASTNVSSSKGQQLVDYAKQFVGLPYVYAKADPNVGFDCSGLVWYVLKHFGVSAPRSSGGYNTAGTAVASLAEAKPGDILCFRDPVGHVGIYVGNGYYLHAPQTGEFVRVELLRRTPSYIRRFVS